MLSSSLTSHEVPADVLSQRQAIEVLWTIGDLSWKLRPEQEYLRAQIYAATYQLIVGNISRRWGKTFTLVSYVLEQAFLTKQKIRYGAAFKTDLEEFVLPAFEILLEDCPEYLKPVWVAGKSKWVFKNGSEIKLVGLDKNPNGLRGNAINIIVIDEAGFVSRLKYIYQSVIIPATAKQKNIKILIFSTPPESPEHFFVELINKAQTQDNGFYLELTIDDISDLEPAERKRLLDEVGGEESDTAQREFFCQIIVAPDRAICKHFDPKIHVADIYGEDRHRIDESLRDLINPDHVSWGLFGDTGGVRDKTVYLKVGWDHYLGLVIFDDELWFKPKTPTPIITNAVKEWQPGLSLVQDAPGQLQIDYSADGLPGANPMKDDFGAGLLLLDSTFYSHKAIASPRCKLLSQTLKNGMLTKNKNDYERTESLGHCDAAAAAIYALRGVDKITDLRPKPKPSQVFINPNKKDSHYGELTKLSGGI